MKQVSLQEGSTIPPPRYWKRGHINQQRLHHPHCSQSDLQGIGVNAQSQPEPSDPKGLS